MSRTAKRLTMKTKLICLCLFGLLCSYSLPAQHRMVKLSNFDPSAYRNNSNIAVPWHPWAYSNIWGHVADGKEYALIGVSGWDNTVSNRGVSIVDVTDPLNPYEAAFVQGPGADQRDFVTYTDPATANSYLYIVGEGGDGMTIVDITGLPSSVSVIHASYYTGTYNSKYASHAHNIQLDEVTGKLLVSGTHGGSEPHDGFMFDLVADPENPVLIATLYEGVDNTYSMHDVYFRNNMLYTASIGAPGTPPDTYVSIYDTSNPLSPYDLIHQEPYPTDQSPSIPVLYLNHVIHDVYVSADGTKMVTSDEHQQGQAIFWDISTLTNPVETDRYSGHTVRSAQHNHVIKGNDRCYVAHYSNGLWMLDISDMNNVQEVAYYDTYLEHNYGDFHPYTDEFLTNPGANYYGTGYYGAWGVFADLPSGNILVCDMNNGLYVLHDCVVEDLQPDNADVTLGNASYANVVHGEVATETITVDPAGTFEVDADGNVTLIAGEKITIKDGVYVQNGGKFHAQIASMCQDCPTCPARSARPDLEAAPAEEEMIAAVFPNPAGDRFNLSLKLSESDLVNATLRDELGRVLIKIYEQQWLDAGDHGRSIDISMLPAGVYCIVVQSGKEQKTIRVSKVK